MPAILATWEAEIGKMAVEVRQGKQFMISHLYQYLGMPVIPVTAGSINRRLKNRGMAQVVEHWPDRHKTPISNLSAPKKINK
jgi:hypothetical protein